MVQIIILVFVIQLEENVNIRNQLLFACYTTTAVLKDDDKQQLYRVIYNY
jgi:hypothetical protein